jgi:translocation protein SEC62
MVEPKKGKWPKNLPKITDRTDAVKIARNLCKAQYLLRAEKVSKGILQMSRNKEFEESGYYAWLFEGDQTYSNLLTGVVIVGFLACVCFPIWPQFLKVREERKKERKKKANPFLLPTHQPPAHRYGSGISQ